MSLYTFFVVHTDICSSICFLYNRTCNQFQQIARKKLSPFDIRYFPMHFIGWKLLNFKWNFIEICYLGLINETSVLCSGSGWVGLWGFLWWAPSAKRKDHHGVSSGWSSVWHRSNTGLSNTQYEQIPIILGVWPYWLTPFFFRSIAFLWAYG